METLTDTQLMHLANKVRTYQNQSDINELSQILHNKSEKKYIKQQNAKKYTGFKLWYTNTLSSAMISMLKIEANRLKRVKKVQAKENSNQKH